MQPFNSEHAFDELLKIMSAMPPNPMPSVFANQIKKGQKYLRQIYEQGVSDGLEVGKKIILNEEIPRDIFKEETNDSGETDP